MGNNSNEIRGNIEKKEKIPYKYNILFIGDSRVGTKTSLIKRIIEGKFIEITDEYKENCETLVFEKEDKKIILYLIDTIDNEREDIIKKYFKFADCIIMGYDVTNEESFQNIVNYWFNKIKYSFNQKLKILLGNKIDLKNNIGLKNKQIKLLAEKKDIKFYSISVKKNINIQNLYNDLKSYFMNKIHNNNIINNGIKEIFYGNPSKECYKIVHLRDCSVGTKTSLIDRLNGKEFDQNYSTTYEACLIKKTIELKNGQEFEAHFWDTSGNKMLGNLTKIFIQNTDCIVLGYDITKRETFDNIKNYWYPTLTEKSGVDLIYLLGNKIDLINERQVSEDEARKYCDEKNFKYFEISCLNYSGIEDFLQDLVDELIKR